MSIDWSVVQEKHILRACQLYDNGKERPLRSAQNTFLILRGKKYPAKHIRGLAYKLATGYALNPSVDYSGGLETARFFKSLGFDVEYKGEVIGSGKPQRRASGERNQAKRDRDPQKDALRKLLEQFFGHVITEAQFDWLVVPDRASMDDSIAKIAEALTSYRGYGDFFSPGEHLRVDFFIPEKRLIIEYDERQHFTIPRAIALRQYPDNLKMGFDRLAWISACEFTQAIDPNPRYRDEQRAFYDSLRDLYPTNHNMTVIRIKDKDYDWTFPNADSYFRKILAQLDLKTANPPESRSGLATELTTTEQADELIIALVVPEVWHLHTKAKSHISPKPGVPLRYEPRLPRAIEFGQEHLDLVVFPESYIRDDDKKRTESLRALANELNTHVLVGASRLHEERRADYEALLLFRPSVRDNEILYYKHSKAGAVAFEFSNWTPERKLPIFQIKNINIGCTICQDSYLGLLQHYLASAKGTRIWINPSYDNVKPEKWEAIHRLRAIENRVISLCTLHDNLGRLDRNAKPRRETIRPFGFKPDGHELLGYPSGKPLEERPLSQCNKPGIYIVRCPVNYASARTNPRLLPETCKQRSKRLRSGPLVEIAIKVGQPHIRCGNEWVFLSPGVPTEVHGIKIIMGLVSGEELFEITRFTQLLDELYAKGTDCKVFLWNQWSLLPCKPEQLVDIMLGRTLEFLVPLVLSDNEIIYEVTERANSEKNLRRISLHCSEGDVSLKFTPQKGLRDSFRITVDSLKGINARDKTDLCEEFLKKYRSLE